MTLALERLNSRCVERAVREHVERLMEEEGRNQ